MGEVYRASDTNLRRDVAIKVLPERLARFEREAKTLASLNHPNLATIHGLEKANGVRALVMEPVEGPTLADRIAQGLIPIDEALPIAKRLPKRLKPHTSSGSCIAISSQQHQGRELRGLKQRIKTQEIKSLALRLQDRTAHNGRKPAHPADSRAPRRLSPR
jgi:serine/threonine protein kinase